MKHKQYAALPYRIVNAEPEVLLITTRKKGRWSVPKGWPMKRRTPSKAAAKEAFEEAGILGRVGGQKVGRFKHRKVTGSKTIRCEVDIFPLTVRGMLNDWPEKHQRKRQWSRRSRRPTRSGPRVCGERFRTLLDNCKGSITGRPTTRGPSWT